MTESAGLRGAFFSTDPTAMTQMSTLSPQGSVDENWTARNVNESLFLYLGYCEAGAFVVTINFIMLVVIFCGLVSNGLVFWLLGFCIKRNCFSVYILNLAGADFFYLCCLVVHSMAFILPDFRAIVPKFIFTITFFFYTLGLSLLVVISTERCVSALFPIWYRCHRPKHTSATVCALLWAAYFLGNLLESHACGLLDFFSDDLMSCLAWDFSFVTLILFLVCVLCVSSLILILKVQCYSQHRRPSKLYVLILLTVLMFLLCGLPMGIGWFLLIWLTDLECSELVFHLLSCVNSSANPFIYFFLGRLRQKRRKESLRVILQRALGEEAEMGEGTEISCTKTLTTSA